MFRHATMLALLLVAGLGLYADDKPRFAGPTQQGFLLPNGWTITPAGTQLPLTDLPLNIHPLRDGKHVLVATIGYNHHQLSLVKLYPLEFADPHSVRYI